MSPKPANVHDLAKLSQSQRKALLTRTETDLSAFTEKVKPIVEAVRVDGDAALSRFALQFDKAKVPVDAIGATEADFARAERTLAQ